MDRFVAVSGLITNSGTIDSPWPLGPILSDFHHKYVKPGDTIHIRGGVYKYPDRGPNSKGWLINLSGTPEARITVRGYNRERATLDGGLSNENTFDFLSCSYVTIRDLEVVVSETETGVNRTSTLAGSVIPTDLNRPWGQINIIRGKSVKIINCNIHDCFQGLSMWSKCSGEGCEAYGNIIWRNGYYAPDREHGHGMYCQNNLGNVKAFRNNILTKGLRNHIQIYGSSSANVDDILYHNNITYNGYGDDRVIIGGTNSASNRNFDICNNVSIDSQWNIGYTVRVSGLICTGNITWGYGGVMMDKIVRGSIGLVTGNFEWGWWAAGPSGTKPLMGSMPTGPKGVLFPNVYDTDRAHIAVLNFFNDKVCKVENVGFLASGDRYALYDPEDFYGAPRYTGKYDGGGSIDIPMTGSFHAYVMMADRSVVSSDCSEIQAQLDAIRAEKFALQSQVTTLTAEKQAITVQLNAVTADRNALQVSLNTANASLVAANSALSAANAHIADLEATNSQLNTFVVGLEGEVSRLNTLNSTLNGQITTLSAQIPVLQSEIATLQASNGALQGQVTDLVTLNEAMKTDLGEIIKLGQDSYVSRILNIAKKW